MWAHDWLQETKWEAGRSSGKNFPRFVTLDGSVLFQKKEPTTCPSYGTHNGDPHPHGLFLWDLFDCYAPVYAYFFCPSMPFGVSDQNRVRIFVLYHSFHMPPDLMFRNLVSLVIFGEESRKFRNVLCSLFSWYLVPLRSKHLPQHPMLWRPQSVFLPYYERLKFYTYTKVLKNDNFLHFKLYAFRLQMTRQKILNRMAANSLHFLTASNYSWIHFRLPFPYLNFSTFWKDLSLGCDFSAERLKANSHIPYHAVPCC